MVVMPSELREEGLACMGEGPVPDVMEKPGGAEEEDVGRVEGQVAGEDRGEVHRPEGVLEPRMVRPRVDQAGEAELLHVPEALDRR